MALPAQFSHLVLSGALPGGERWATGWWNLEAESPGGWTQAEWDARVAQYRTAVETANGASIALGTALQNMLSTGSNWDTVTAYLYEGTLANSSFVGQVSPTGGTKPGTGTTVHPHQVACCVSWRAGAGASRRGRSYFPANGAALITDGHFSSTPVDNLAVGMQSFYTALAIPAVVPVVVSRKLQTAFNCNELQVDNVPDVIRRRVDHLVTTHQAQLALPAA